MVNLNLNSIGIGGGFIVGAATFGACFGLLIGWAQVLSDLDCNTDLLSTTNQAVISTIGGVFAGITAGVLLSLGVLPKSFTMAAIFGLIYAALVSILSLSMMELAGYSTELISVGLVGGVGPSSFFMFILMSLISGKIN